MDTNPFPTGYGQSQTASMTQSPQQPSYLQPQQNITSPTQGVSNMVKALMQGALRADQQNQVKAATPTPNTNLPMANQPAGNPMSLSPPAYGMTDNANPQYALFGNYSQGPIY